MMRGKIKRKNNNGSSNNKNNTNNNIEDQIKKYSFLKWKKGGKCRVCIASCM